MIDHDETPESEAPADPWSAVLPGLEPVPSYLTSRFAAQYRVIVEVLLAQQDTSLTGLSYDEVAAGVRAHLADRMSADVVDRLMGPEVLHLDARLDRLVRWRVLTRWQEPARIGEDFLRRRDRYQLTPQAASLHAFWSSVDDAEEAAGDLTLAPRAIHDRLVAFAESIEQAVYTSAATEFQQIGAMHHAMATSARAWQRTLAHALSGGPDVGKQDELWQTLRSYIGMWGEQVDVHSPRIAELVGELDPLLTPEVWRACVRATVDAEVGDEVVAAQAQRWMGTWKALASWFGGSDSQARRLRRQLRDLVAPWARNMKILLDTGGAVTRRTELLALARAVEQAPDDETAWQAWDTAVGQFSARHLLLTSDSADDHDLSWMRAPAAPVTARFREQGARAAVGRRAKIPDYSTGKREARRARRAAEAARNGAEAALRQRSGTRLAEWGDVSDAELDLLMELIGVVRRTRSESSVTGDGRWRITLHRPEFAHDTTTLHAESGSMVLLNWHFRMDPA
ncbi:TIGR02677 family protein [Saccharopolyspora antimicrobica]|uniref:TIGR02677 family protein n=1 Tax=Saccharopolyspora antimicrobica TaxID=455193 RepID=A0A1I5EYV1_9PSEU|nr:DUF2397 domain-containing protein [Saccharopolyspora antimicrobica]RKT83603.1 uncharacterized protein (TIGR02677 family) [Saccharopolyspora antimicrobica]SFO16682.1 TIGR02677 family protein [Saccharopolyspora antimicrobica]